MTTRSPRSAAAAAVGDHLLGLPVRGDHVDLDRDVELGERLGGGLHDGPVRVRPHDDPHQGLRCHHRLRRLPASGDAARPSCPSGPVRCVFASGGRVAAQQGRRGDRPRADVVEVVAADVDVAELAARAAPPCRTGAPWRRGSSRRDVGAARRSGPRSVLPSTFAMTVHGARAAVSPSGRSSTARRCCSNWLVTAPSMVQWPELCGRIASSLTSTRGGPPAGVRDLEELDGEHAGDAEPLGDRGRPPRPPRPASPGPGRERGRRPRRTRRRAAPTRPRATCAISPLGRRATRTASSRVNGTFSSASSGTPVPSAAAANQSATSRGVAHDPHALAVVPAARRLHHGRAAVRPRGTPSGRGGRRRAAAQPRAPARRASVSRVAHDDLVLRVHAARPRPGAPRRPRPRARSSSAFGTCSCSKVSTSAPSTSAGDRGLVGRGARPGRRPRPAPPTTSGSRRAPAGARPARSRAPSCGRAARHRPRPPRVLSRASSVAEARDARSSGHLRLDDASAARTCSAPSVAGTNAPPARRRARSSSPVAVAGAPRRRGTARCADRGRAAGRPGVLGAGHRQLEVVDRRVEDLRRVEHALGAIRIGGAATQSTSRSSSGTSTCLRSGRRAARCRSSP